MVMSCFLSEESGHLVTLMEHHVGTVATDNHFLYAENGSLRENKSLSQDKINTGSRTIKVNVLHKPSQNPVLIIQL